MADYYFCNATTKQNAPCQNHVRKEGDRCHHHDPNGSRARRFMDSAYKAGGKALTAICYIYSSQQAIRWVVDLAGQGLNTFNGILPRPIPEAEYDHSDSGKPEFLSFLEEVLREYQDFPDAIKQKLLDLDEEQLEEFSAMCNHLVIHIPGKGQAQRPVVFSTR